MTYVPAKLRNLKRGTFRANPRNLPRKYRTSAGVNRIGATKNAVQHASLQHDTLEVTGSSPVTPICKCLKNKGFTTTHSKNQKTHRAELRGTFRAKRGEPAETGAK